MYQNTLKHMARKARHRVNICKSSNKSKGKNGIN